MTKRSFLLTAALGLLGSLVFSSPSHAAIVTVSEQFTITPATAGSATISSAVVEFTGLNGISDLKFSGIAVNGSFVNVAVGLSTMGPEDVKLTFTGDAALVSGTLSLTTTASTSNVMLLPGLIKIDPATTSAVGGTIATTPVSFSIPNTVPEPSAMALLGIGMTSFLAFRRFFKRNIVA